MKWQLNTYLCFVGRILLEPSVSSSYSFRIASFLIQMLRWIRGSSRVEFFIFLIAWGIFFGLWELDLQFLPSSLLFLWIELLLLLEVCWNVITSFWNTFLEWMNSTILGGHSRWPSPLLHSSLLQVVLDLRDSYDCMVSAFWIFTFFN